MDFNKARAALANPKNVRFADLVKICREAFGDPRIRGSHHVFPVPWQGKPWVNLQSDGKMAKDYQVKDVLAALEKLEKMLEEKTKKEAEAKNEKTSIRPTKKI